MRNLLRICITLLLTGVTLQGFGQRYLTEIFSGVNKTSDVTYAVNVSVLTGSPAADTLKMDIYEPMGDSQTERPVILLAHTGSFLPVPQNGTCTGSRKDSSIVEVATQFAKRGYVVAAFSYRLGWNPVSSNQDVRTGTLLNAAYRGIQDARTLVRYFKSNYSTGGNTWGVDTSLIIVGGQGTGGYISLAVSSLDQYPELFMTKFTDGVGTPYADTSLSGDLEGKWNRPLNVGNYTGYNSDVNITFNYGGAVGDSSWINAGEPPIVGFHVPNDPFAPYGYGAVIVPTTGDFVVNVSGSQGAVQRSQNVGNQDALINLGINDIWSQVANSINGGLEGLCPFQRNTPESAPWEWWNEAYWSAIPHPAGGTFNDVCKMTNPDMSKTKALAYIDTLMGYVNPRLVGFLGLATSVEQELAAGSITAFPNPAQGQVAVRADQAAGNIQEVIMYNFSGRKLRHYTGLNSSEFVIDQDGLAAGIYVLQIKTNKGMLNKKLIFQ